MAAQPEMTSEFARPVLAVKMLRATVKIIMGDAVWTGTIIGQKDEKSLVLTVAHSIPSWMDIPDMDRALAVQFYGTIVLERCRIVRFDRQSDIMLLVVDKPTPEEYTMKLASEGEWGLVESQLIGARCHPVGQHQWTFMDGEVCTPRLVNKDFYGIMNDYYSDLIFFEHRLDMGKGCSGAALVNLNGNMVGMQTENAMVGVGSLRYGLNDAVTIPVIQSRIKYAIHVEYIKGRIQGNGNRSLEDIYISAPSFAD